MFKYFCVLASPRTGSNLLIGILNQHPAIVCHYELYHWNTVYLWNDPRKRIPDEVFRRLSQVEYRNSDPVQFLDEVFRETEHAYPQSSSYGFKLFYHQEKEIVARVQHDNSIGKVLLYRENLLDQYASYRIAVESGRWSRRVASEDKQIRIKFEQSEFLHFVDEHREYLINARSILDAHACPYIMVEYQQVCTGQLKPVLDYLSTHATFDYTLPLAKQNSTRTIDKFSNFPELERSLGNTEFESWIVR